MEYKEFISRTEIVGGNECIGPTYDGFDYLNQNSSRWRAGNICGEESLLGICHGERELP